MPRGRLPGPVFSHRIDPESSAVKTDIVLPHLPDGKRTRVGGGFELAPWTDRRTDRLGHINQPNSRKTPPAEEPQPEHPRVGGGFKLGGRPHAYQKPNMGYNAQWEITIESECVDPAANALDGHQRIERFTMKREDITLAGLRSKLKTQHRGKLPRDFLVVVKSSRQELTTDDALMETLAELGESLLQLTIEQRTRTALEEWFGLSMYKDVEKVLKEIGAKAPEDLTVLWPEDVKRIRAKLTPVQMAKFEKKYAALMNKHKKKNVNRKPRSGNDDIEEGAQLSRSRRVGGGYYIYREYEGITDDDEPVPETSSPNRAAAFDSPRGFGQRRNFPSWKLQRKSGTGPEYILCQRPVTVGKCAMWFLIVHSSIEIWGALCAFCSWFACNFYPEYTDLMWDVLCGMFVAIAAAYVVGSTVGCECICCTMVKSNEKVVTRGSNWPKYLYTIACVSAIVAVKFGAHPAVVSNDPFAEELPSRPPNGLDPLTESEGCAEPLAWCLLATDGRPYDRAAARTNNCTNVMKYWACADGIEDDSCAEEMPFLSWRAQAESGGTQQQLACSSRGVQNNAEEPCSYKLNYVPCPPPPAPSPPHGYTIVRCVETIWTARVLLMAMICRVIGAIGAGLVSLRVYSIAPGTYKYMGPNGKATAQGDMQTEPTNRARSQEEHSDVDVFTATESAEKSPLQGATRTALRPQDFSPGVDIFSPIPVLSNRSGNQWSETPARLHPHPHPHPQPEPEPEPEPLRLEPLPLRSPAADY